MFNTLGHHVLGVTVTREDPPPDWPGRPVQTTFSYDVYVVAAAVAEVSFHRQPYQQGEPIPKSLRLWKTSPDWQDDIYGERGDHRITPPEWKAPPFTPKPVCYKGGEDPILVVNVLFTNPQQQYGPSLPFELAGESPDPHDPGAGLEFSGEGLGSGSGAYMEDEVVAFNLMPWALPQRVSNSTRTFSWKVRSGNGWTDLGETSNPFWVTWGAPYGSSVTARRIDWVTDKAHGCTGVASIGQAIWEALSGDAPYDPDDEGFFLILPDWNRWALLDGFMRVPLEGGGHVDIPTYGECDEQAELMSKALSMLGVAWVIQKVYGSTADYNFVEPEWRECPTHQWLEWLVINYDGQYHSFGACCVVPDLDGVWYCLYPVLYTSSDWHMCYYLVCTPNYQQWVKTNNNEPPGEGGTPPFTFCDTEPAPEP